MGGGLVARRRRRRRRAPGHRAGCRCPRRRGRRAPRRRSRPRRRSARRRGRPAPRRPDGRRPAGPRRRRRRAGRSTGRRPGARRARGPAARRRPREASPRSRRAPDVTISSSIASSRGQVRRLGAPRDLERPLRPAQGPLGVGHHRHVRGPAHAAAGPQFRERLGPVPGVVGGEPAGLAHHGDAGRPVAGEPGVGQGGLGVVVEELPGGDEVPRHGVGEVLRAARAGRAGPRSRAGPASPPRAATAPPASAGAACGG